MRYEFMSNSFAASVNECTAAAAIAAVRGVLATLEEPSSPSPRSRN
jgi:hypothetical protein